MDCTRCGIISLFKGGLIMKILHVITGLEMGGAEHMLLKILTQDKDNHHIVVSLTEGGVLKESFEKTGHQIESLDLSRGKLSFSAIKKLATLIHIEDPDIIQGWMYHGNLAALAGKILGFCGADLYWNIRHSLHDIKHEKKSTAWIIRLCGLLSFIPKKIIYNAHMSQMQHQKFWYSSKKSVILPNGFDTDKFSPNASNRLKWRETWACDDKTKVYGMIARYHPMKDHETLLNGFAKALENKKIKAKLVLIGTNVDGDNSALSNLIEKLSLKDHVVLMGERRDINEILPAFDYAILSSAWGEGFSNFLGESMACGIPAIATNIGDNARIVDEYGIVISAQNSDQLSNAIITMNNIDQDDYHRLSSACRIHINDNFTIDKITKDYLSLYRQEA